MPPRYRSKPQLPGRYRFGDGPWVELVGDNFDEQMFDNVPGSGPCTHIKRVTGRTYYASPWDLHVENQGIPSWMIEPPPLKELEWANLPSSTENNIIALLAEMDEIIAMLTKKFWRHLSYGAVTWGIVPLISEISSGLKAVERLAQSIDGTHYEADTYSVEKFDFGSMNLQPPQTHTKFTKSVKYHAYGKAHYKELELSALLDRLGFHPDPATLWELVPFSFVVDYIFPIGKFLEGLRRGGWVKAVYFDGWVSATVNTAGIMYQPSYTGWRTVPHEVPFEYSAYFRHPHSAVLVAPEADLPQFELPTFEEAYNMAYLANKKLRSVAPPIHWDWVFQQEDS